MPDSADGEASNGPTPDHRPVGTLLRETREGLRLSLEDVAAGTRIRLTYLLAIEASRPEDLPSRPFTLGYIRAYAEFLGLDGPAAIARFKSDEPDLDLSLRAPIGVHHEARRRSLALVIVSLLVVGAVVAWNIGRRSPKRPDTPSAHTFTTPGRPTTGPILLGPPLPTPEDSSAPPAYVTPGLEAVFTQAEPDLASGAKAARPQLSQSFVARGPVYGAEAVASDVTLLALESTPLIVRNAAGAPIFARQLARGEAYRLPRTRGLSMETVKDGALQVFVAGASRGLLPIGRSPAALFLKPQAG